jgi:hypothetical protein
MRIQENARSTGMILLMVYACLVCAGSAHSGEFRPYDLPSKSQQRTMTQEQLTNQEEGRVIDESAYTDFQRKVASMTLEQKADLRVYFSKKREQAQELQEYKYYSRLIDILNKK